MWEVLDETPREIIHKEPANNNPQHLDMCQHLDRIRCKWGMEYISYG